MFGAALSLLLLNAPLAAAPAPGWFHQAEAAIEGGRLVEAAAVLAQAAADRDPGQVARLKARLFAAEGRFGDALKLFADPALSTTLDCTDRKHWLRAAIEGAGGDAVTLGEQAAAACPQSADIWLGRAVLADRAANWTEAAAFYEKAAALDPDNRLIPTNAGYSLILQRRFAEAEALIARAVQRWPGDVTLENNWDIARGALGLDPEPRKGETAERRAERLNNAGYAALLADRRDAARALLTRALEAGDRASQTTLANWARAGVR